MAVTFKVHGLCCYKLFCNSKFEASFLEFLFKIVSEKYPEIKNHCKFSVAVPTDCG